MTIIDIIQKVRHGHVDSGTKIVFTQETWAEWKPKLEIVSQTFRATRDYPGYEKMTKFIEAREKEFKG